MGSAVSVEQVACANQSRWKRNLPWKFCDGTGGCLPTQAGGNRIRLQWSTWNEGVAVKKTTSGVVLVAGPLLALAGGVVSSYANRQDSTPDMDWQWNLINGVGVLMMLTGLMAFFLGAMWFSRK